MFLARKTENFLMSIEDFFAVLKSSANSAESILNLEFLVCKNIHFHFTIHHPYRPCLGFFYDMQVGERRKKSRENSYPLELSVVSTRGLTRLDTN